MTMWMDLINDHIDYNSMSDSYYCNIGIYAWYRVLNVNYLLSESAIPVMFTTCKCQGVNTLM